MIDTAKLKEKILDLAIRGKLVPQDPNDEPASVLLEKIRAEKLQMVKDGKLKQKDIKDDTVIFVGDDNLHYEKFADGSVKCIEDEMDFSLPKAWIATRLQTVLKLSSGRDLTQEEYSNDPIGIPYITGASNFNKESITTNRHTKYPQVVVNEGDLLITCKGTIGEIAYCPYKEAHIARQIMAIKNTFNLNSKYITVCIKYYLNKIKRSAKGLIPGIAREDLLNLIVPLPSMKEQVRIVEKVEEYDSYLKTLNENKEDLLTLINLLKSNILDLAIRGKLVPQDPNDEPTDVLLERIRKEKEELIKQGKIKRDKKESIIFKGDDNSYYGNIPDNWSLTTLKEITNNKELNDGDWIVSDDMVNFGPVKLIQLGSIGFMNYIEKGYKYLTLNTFKRLNCSAIKEDYLLINRIVDNKMCCCMLPKINGTLITTVDTCWIAPNNNHYNIKYLMFALSSPLFQSEVNYKSSGTTRRRISKLNLINMQFPFPPILEQKKIVDEVKKLFKFIDNIAFALK